MIRNITLLLIGTFIILSACSDVVDETIVDKDLEEGKYDSSFFNEAKWGD
ncbi:MAG: hypothetical protein ACOCX9_02840 [Spirochaetota bacterium]